MKKDIESAPRGNVLWVLAICFVLSFWALMPLMCHWCVSRASAQSGWGTPADLCDLDDVDCSPALDLDLLQYETGMWSATPVSTVMADYARLDGATTTGPYVFGDQVHSTVPAGCTTPAEISLTAPPVTINGTTYSFAPGDAPPDGCGACTVGGFFVLVEGGALGMAGWSCCNNQVQIFDDPNLLSLLHEQNLALCAISVPSFGVHLAVLSLDDCDDVRTALQAAFGNPDPPLALDTSDSDFYAWNSSTCSWSLDLEAGWSIFTADCGLDCGNESFPASPAMTSDSSPVPSWSVSTGGEAEFEDGYFRGTVGVGTSPDPNTGIYVETYRDAVHDGSVSGLMFFARNTPTQNVVLDPEDPQEVRGFYGVAQLFGAYDFPVLSGGGAAAQYYATAGTVSQTMGHTSQILHGGGGTLTTATVYRPQLYVWDDGDIETAVYFPLSSYQGTFLSGAGTIGDLVGIDVPDVTGYDGDSSRITGSATAIRVAAQTDPSLGYAADWGWETRHRDDIRAYFGDDEDFALYFDSTEAALVMEGSSPFFLKTDLKTDRWQGSDTNLILGMQAAGAGNMTVAALDNLLLGNLAGYSLTSGYENVSAGSNAGQNVTTGYQNVLLGHKVANRLVSGYQNVFIGRTAGSNSTNSRFNVAVGRAALSTAEEDTVEENSIQNVAVGAWAGFGKIQTSSGNVFVGNVAGRYLHDGSTNLEKATNSIYIGSRSRGLSTSDSNSIVIGYEALGQGANTTVIGNEATALAYIKGSQVYTVEDVTCGNGTNTCAYNADIVTTRLTSDDDADGADVVTVTDGVDGQRRTFVLAVDGGDDVTIDVSSNGNGTDTTLTAAGQSVTYEYDAVTDTWQTISKNP